MNFIKCFFKNLFWSFIFSAIISIFAGGLGFLLYEVGKKYGDIGETITMIIILVVVVSAIVTHFELED